jgi:hypothetical protein
MRDSAGSERGDAHCLNDLFMDFGGNLHGEARVFLAICRGDRLNEIFTVNLSACGGSEHPDP